MGYVSGDESCGHDMLSFIESKLNLGTKSDKSKTGCAMSGLPLALQGVCDCASNPNKIPVQMEISQIQTALCRSAPGKRKAADGEGIEAYRSFMEHCGLAWQPPSEGLLLLDASGFGSGGGSGAASHTMARTPPPAVVAEAFAMDASFGLAAALRRRRAPDVLGTVTARQTPGEGASRHWDP
jgi:hypothetical protein